MLLTVALIAAPVPGQAEPSEVTWGERIEVASGDAYQGPWRMNESEFHYVDDPTVTINEAGVVGLAWADQSRQDIFFQIYGPDGQKRFEAPVNVSKSPRVFCRLGRACSHRSTSPRIVRALHGRLEGLAGPVRVRPGPPRPVQAGGPIETL